MLSILATWRWRRRYARALQAFGIQCQAERIVREITEAATHRSQPLLSREELILDEG